MIKFFRKPGRYAAVYTVILILAAGLVLLDTFVFPKRYALATAAETNSETSVTATAETTRETSPAAAPEAAGESEPVITADSYQDENMTITIETVRAYDTTYYVADIQLSDPALLQTAFAENTYGRNIKQTTSAMAADNNAVLAINGDYYGFRDYGYVIRNGVLYRDTDGGDEALVIDTEGNFTVVNEDIVTAQTLLDQGAWQVLSFGPALVSEGQIAVSETEEVSGKSSDSNPRTAIGQVGTGHYLVVVSDGRTDESAGLSLYQLALVFADRGAETAYNLDGGGSSTMVFNGTIVNTTTSGRGNNEREVSDIVYFG